MNIWLQQFETRWICRFESLFFIMTDPMILATNILDRMHWSKLNSSAGLDS
jgi:hypothetical protein